MFQNYPDINDNDAVVCGSGVRDIKGQEYIKRYFMSQMSYSVPYVIKVDYPHDWQACTRYSSVLCHREMNNICLPA